MAKLLVVATTNTRRLQKKKWGLGGLAGSALLSMRNFQKLGSWPALCAAIPALLLPPSLQLLSDTVHRAGPSLVKPSHCLALMEGQGGERLAAKPSCNLRWGWWWGHHTEKQKNKKV
mmetsp:Transcript_25658/g.42348  ORF Transcript_25658/g.42348 Transcript_25658/m.42348 type:complete len:117 (+) Transcript_25658:327-677(+)